MGTHSANPYDVVPYVSRPFSHTHPEHLAVIGRLRGLDPAPPDRARVLEIGAGDGANLIAMAVAAPGARFTGVELAHEPVQRGRRRLEALGLQNVELWQCDLMALGPDAGVFDFLVAHGLYAWTPPAVRDQILAIAAAHLAPHGIALVSYNTHPGGHLRQIVRDAVRFAAPPTLAPADRRARGREMLHLLALPRPDATPLDTVLAGEATAALAGGDNVLFHDYLSEDHQPVRFDTFIENAARQRLQYLDDAGVVDAWNPRLDPAAASRAADLAGPDRVVREQCLDFLRVRRFRQSLLCHSGHVLTDDWSIDRAVGLLASSRARETAEGQFTGPLGVSVTTRHDGVLRWLRRLVAASPSAESVGAAEAEMSLELFRRGLIDLRISASPAGPAGDRPVASPLARLQVSLGDAEISTLTQRVLAITPEVGAFLLLLDGSRDRAALSREAGLSSQVIDSQLDLLARHGLIVAAAGIC